MNFNTVTKSGVFQYIPKDPTVRLDEDIIEYTIIKRFEEKFGSKCIYLEKYSANLPLSFVIAASSTYNTSNGGKKQHHPDYSELVISTGYLNGIADSLNLKCTRSGA